MTNADANRTRTASWQDPMITADALRQMSGLEFLHAMMRGELPPPPISQILGFALVEASEGRAVFATQPAEFHYNPIGVVHGGLAATLLDSAMACAIQTMLPAGVGYTSLDISVNYIRAITRETGSLRCEAEIIHVGKRTGTSQGRLVDVDGRLYAHGTTTCIIFRP
jgi:uncharacterized protein (TIGR00369 family)